VSIQNKHSEQFMELFIPVKRQISNYCRTLTGNGDVARDLLQDTLLAAYEGFGNLRKQDSFLFFLCGIARRIYLKQIRRNKFWADNNKIDSNHYVAFDLEGDISADIQILNKALSQLPPEQRESIVLFEIIGFSLEEIKAIQGGSLSGVKTRIVRARQKLLIMLADGESMKSVSDTTKKIKV
jgi:RNA polymerase sigma-70 factor, ECF subfamily